MKSTVRAFDGIGDGECHSAGRVFQMKTEPYGAVQQSSGSEPQAMDPEKDIRDRLYRRLTPYFNVHEEVELKTLRNERKRCDLLIETTDLGKSIFCNRNKITVTCSAKKLSRHFFPSVSICRCADSTATI
jgi:hypothetical protein